MPLLRNLIFKLLLIILTIIVGTLALPSLIAPGATLVIARLWCRLALYILKVAAGVGYQLTGKLPNIKENEGYIIASKHQSAFETFLLVVLAPRPIFIVKRELIWIPIFGWYLWRIGAIGIKRADGKKSLQLIKHKAKQRLAEGCQLIIFPEGTRHPFGAKPQYKRGIVTLYQLGYPVVPVSLNAGYYWPKKGAITPGVITVKILPTIPAGLAPEEFMARLIASIEGNIAPPVEPKLQ